MPLVGHRVTHWGAGSFSQVDVMAYRTIHGSFWTDPEVEKLTPTAKLVFLYLITNEHAHLSGLYHITVGTISDETGVDIEQVELALSELTAGRDTLSDRVSHRVSDGVYDRSSGHAPKPFVRREGKMLWVVNMFKYQGSGDKVNQAVEKHFKTLHKCKLIQEFVIMYPEIDLTEGNGHAG
jgi:hypothetical protein